MELCPGHREDVERRLDEAQEAIYLVGTAVPETATDMRRRREARAEAWAS